MAYPLEPYKLIAFLRAFSVATSDSDNESSSVIKPLPAPGHNSTPLYLAPNSPPIPYDLPSVTCPLEPTQPSSSKKTTAKLHRKIKSPKRAHTESPKSITNDAILLHPALDDASHSRSPNSLTTLSNPSDLERLDLYHDGRRLTTPVKSASHHRNNSKVKNPLAKLFHKSEKQHLPSSLDSSTAKPPLFTSSRNSLGLTSGKNIFSMGSGHPGSADANAERVLGNYASDDFDVAPHSIPDTELGADDHYGPGGSSKHRSVDGTEVSVRGRRHKGGGSDNETDDGDEDDEYEDDDEDNYENATKNNKSSISSTDSNFTDIEGDSMIEVGSSMCDYSVGDSYLLRDPDDIKKGSKKESRSKNDVSFPASTSQRTAFTNSAPAGRPKNGALESLVFEKNYAAVGKPLHTVAHSNLSTMIQSRFKNCTSNPLHFYSFVGSNTDSSAGARVETDIFVPPKMKPVISKLELLNTAAVHEVIGFILLNLSELPEYKEESDPAFMNPNQWRLELIDEDGELYDGNFGVLDRTRQLVSYNSPNCLALCRVEKKAEIANNEKATPLAPDFKHNLKTFNAKPPTTAPSENQQPAIESMDNGETTEVKVGNIPDENTHIYVSFFINAAMTVGQLLDLICQQYFVDSSRYRLAAAEDINKQNGTLLGNEMEDSGAWQKPLDNSLVLTRLSTNHFKFVPNLAQQIRPMTDVQVDNTRVTDVGITPSSTTFMSSTGIGITPPKSKGTGQNGEAMITKKALQQGNAAAAAATSEPATAETATKNTIRKNRSAKNLNDTTTKMNGLTFGDILNQNRPQLPANINTIYFKWTVYRRKPPLLNRIEKSLIIDGDYIHLAPTDDATWSKTPHESAFSASNLGHHHHHHLHHYNYSKFYNDTMMKTSSFHISQIVKLKQYKQSKNPNHFKIVINKHTDNESTKEPYVKKKYDLEAASMDQCEEIVEKIKWTMQVYDNMIEQ